MYWWSLWIAAAGGVLIWRVGAPVHRTLAYDLRVTAVVRESPGVVSSTMRGRNLHRLPVAAGQFFNWRFLAGPGRTRSHPYSLSAAPTGDTVQITVKDLGDGSRARADLRPGTRVAIEGPYGRLHAGVRRVANIRPGTSTAELADLHDARVCGIRFTFVKRLVDPKPDGYYRGLVDLVAELGWHVVVYFEADDLAERWGLFTSLPTTVVVDHMGRPDVGKAPDGAEFGLFVRMMTEHENVWSKVSCPERLSISGPPEYADVRPFARRIVELFPDRVLWGTDWPHPNLKGHMPDDGHLVDVIPHIARTGELQRRLLVDNPARLYWEA